LGQHFAFYLNGEWVAEVEDGTWAEGRAGLLASLFDEGDVGSFIFDNFELRVP
jgi:hypothetical protein